MLIRRARPEDVDRIIELNNREEKWVGEEVPEFFRDYIGRDIPILNVCEDRTLGVPIQGFILVMDRSVDYESRYFNWFKNYFDEQRGGSNFLYVDRVVIDPSMRKRGLAFMFYEAMRTALNEFPISAEVSIEPINLASVRFHEKCGFRKVGEFSSDGKKTCAMMVLD